MKRKAGKIIGDCIYIHRLYEKTIVPKATLKTAKAYIPNDYTCVKYNKKTQVVTFQWSYNFDIAHEPIVDKCIIVKPDGTQKIIQKSSNPFIWHHKWQWVADDYTGFDVEQSKARSRQWKPFISSKEKLKIGRLSYWNLVRKRWE